jgi:hypothetical protein
VAYLVGVVPLCVFLWVAVNAESDGMAHGYFGLSE